MINDSSLPESYMNVISKHAPFLRVMLNKSNGNPKQIMDQVQFPLTLSFTWILSTILRILFHTYVADFMQLCMLVWIMYSYIRRNSVTSYINPYILYLLFLSHEPSHTVSIAGIVMWITYLLPKHLLLSPCIYTLFALLSNYTNVDCIPLEYFCGAIVFIAAAETYWSQPYSYLPFVPNIENEYDEIIKNFQFYFTGHWLWRICSITICIIFLEKQIISPIQSILLISVFIFSPFNSSKNEMKLFEQHNLEKFKIPFYLFFFIWCSLPYKYFTIDYQTIILILHLQLTCLFLYSLIVSCFLVFKNASELKQTLEADPIIDVSPPSQEEKAAVDAMFGDIPEGFTSFTGFEEVEEETKKDDVEIEEVTKED